MRGRRGGREGARRPTTDDDDDRPLAPSSLPEACRRLVLHARLLNVDGANHGRGGRLDGDHIALHGDRRRLDGDSWGWAGWR